MTSNPATESPVSNYETLTRAELATLVPELVMAGHLIDRAGMAYCLSAFGHPEMTQIAIEEWMAASPIYTQRMQRALRFEGTDVPTIFKGIQLDIGAPPQFLDFRFKVDDANHGEFWLDHCGALADVEPMGTEHVRAMCHDIEDPTFDATAVATNPKAQVRPIHRPPRVPAGRSPVCAWTVIIDDSYPAIEQSEGNLALLPTRAAGVELAPIDAADFGAADYSGPLVSDIDFTAYSRSALVRIADEFALQSHLLSLGFVWAIRRRGTDEQVREITTAQVTGVAGVGARRIHAALGLGNTPADAVKLLSLHPLLNPSAYVVTSHDGDRLRLFASPAHEDDGWLQCVGLESIRPLQAIVREVDPRFDLEVSAGDDSWEVHVIVRDEAARALEEVAITGFSTGTTFEFQRRKSLPIMPV